MAFEQLAIAEFQKRVTAVKPARSKRIRYRQYHAVKGQLLPLVTVADRDKAGRFLADWFRL